MADQVALPEPEPGERRCIGSTKFGIAAHNAPLADFNPQPSQPGGLARMCRADWSRYTRALRTGSTEPQPRKNAAAPKAPRITDAASLNAAFPDVDPKAKAPKAYTTALPENAVDVETPEGQQVLADAAEAAQEARKAADRAAAKVRMANLRARRKADAEAAAAKA